MPNIVVAVTNYNWFQAVSQLPNVNEVNFWGPSGRNLRALQPGECLLFKLPAPHNMIVGGGLFAYSEIRPIAHAWEEFGEANGAGSLEELREVVAGVRNADLDNQGDFNISCRILTEPFFFDQVDWVDPPDDWAPNIVTYKKYDTDNIAGRNFWQEVQNRLRRQGDAQ